jgi:hypothetical protein
MQLLGEKFRELFEKTGPANAPIRGDIPLPWGSSRQPRKLIFGMQPYFDPTRKMTSKKKWKTTSKK